MIGLFFFIRASVKDRTEQTTITSKLPEEKLLSELQNYLTHRAYRLKAVDEKVNQVIFEGLVSPSWFLAFLLTILAFFGLLSIGLVLHLLYPNLGSLAWLPATLAPIAGIFYWQNAGRPEQVCLSLKSQLNSQNEPEITVQITAHRDELLELEKSLADLI